MSLFGEQTYEALLAGAMARVSPSLDKREGSMVYNGIAPSMAELAQLYIGLDFVFAATYLATAPREYLIRRAADRGLAPKAASAAVFRAELNMPVPIGTRFSCEELNFTVTERMNPAEDTETGLSYKVTCETAGSAANKRAGALIPIEYIAGLTRAVLCELLIPGEDEEDTEVFRRRVLDSIQTKSFGGNQADYKAKVLEIPGVSAVKVHPAWNADTPPAALIPSAAVQAWYDANIDGITDAAAKAWLNAVYSAARNRKLTVGGTVKLVIMAANGAPPSEELIDTVQTAVDPVQNAGEGLGLAPIGHVVLVEGVKYTPITVCTHLTFAAGYTWNDAKSHVNAAVSAYFDELAKAWETSGSITLRISQLESRILSACAALITDIDSTTLNGKAANLTLGEDSLPALAPGGVVHE